MIYAKELRIGNIIDCEQLGGQAIVTSIGATSFKVKDFDLGLLYERNNPIPLTEEILLKCGFEKEATINDDNVDYFIGHNEITHDRLFSISWLKWRSKPETIFYRNGRHQIKHLHQLQNLYFALTNTELTYTP